MLCNFEYSDAKNGCVFAWCRRCGYSTNCIKKLPLRRQCAKETKCKGTAGSQLKKLLAVFFVASQNCRCNARAEHMNAMGNDWCEQNIETIVEWLKEEAAARGLPFISTVGRMLVRRAIQNARKEAQRAKADT